MRVLDHRSEAGGHRYGEEGGGRDKAVRGDGANFYVFLLWTEEKGML